ncbi:MAG: minor capsid protein [Candidatus Fimivivens sp.]
MASAQEYWAERAEQNAQRIFDYSQRRARLVTRWFGRASRDMQTRVNDFYRRYAEGEQISPQAAKATLTDRRALAMTMQEAERLATLHPQDKVIAQLLGQASTQRAISREEFLQLQLQLLATELYGEAADTIHRTLTEIFEDSYYHTLFNSQQFIGYGSSFNRISTHQIEAAITTAWKGKNYSERLWGSHRQSLARYLNRIISTGMAEGRSNSDMRAQLQKAMDMSAYEARRLIRTEGAQVASRASLAGYQEFGTPQFEFLATLDFKTSEICREMDSKTFDVADGKIGVNMPPLHPFCRSTTVPYIPDPEFDDDDTRVARGSDGITYKVPADMTYNEWHKQYVETVPAELLAQKKAGSGRADSAQYAKYKALLGEDAPKTFDAYQTMRYTDADSREFLKLDYRRRRRLQLNPELALPDALTATAANAKFTGYLFGGENAAGLAKGAAFKSRLGYDATNWHILQQELLRKAPLYPCKPKGEDAYGMSYEQKIIINGLLGTPANVIVGWKVKDGKMWMTSAYIKEVD